MSLATPARQRPRDLDASWARPERDFAVGTVPLLLVLATSCWSLGLPASRAGIAGMLYLVVAALFLRHFPASHPGPGIGAANRVTLGRSILVLAVVAIATTNGPLTPVGYWSVLLMSIVATALDGVDGRIARRTRTEGTLGGRFDMEVDALLILALSAIVWQSGKVGVWVLLIGTIRYLFVAVGAFWRPLEKPLPPVWRRKAICVVQSITLIVCVAPIVPTALAMPASAAALLLLVYSFTIDVVWLIESHRASARATSPLAGG